MDNEGRVRAVREVVAAMGDHWTPDHGLVFHGPARRLFVQMRFVSHRMRLITFSGPDPSTAFASIAQKGRARTMRTRCRAAG